MKARLIPIGNSRGIRIPKAILEQCEMSDEVELVVEGRQIILSPTERQPRQGWREAAARMVAAGDDGFRPSMERPDEGPLAEIAERDRLMEALLQATAHFRVGDRPTREQMHER